MGFANDFGDGVARSDLVQIGRAFLDLIEGRVLTDAAASRFVPEPRD